MKKIVLLSLCLLGVGWTGVAQAATYGVFVGLNEYNTSYVGADNFLNGCVPDANHIYTNTIKRGAWTTGTVTRLLNSAGTKNGIRQAISNYAATAVSGDTFFYYHSSHGGQNSGTSVYLCSYNADYDDTEVAADLEKFATGVKVIVMVDACHSGGLFQSAKAGTRALVPASGTWDLAGSVTRIMDENRAAALAANVKDVEARVSSSEIGWITAANYDQYSWDGDTGGLFTDKVIEGWTNPVASSSDLNGDSYANFYELYKYASNVANNADYEYTQGQAHNTNVLLNTMAGWIGATAPGGLVVFSNLTAQTVVVGQTLIVSVGAYTSGTNLPATVTMSTVQAGASYGSGQLTFTPTMDGIYTFNFSATNSTGGSASASLTVTATLAAPIFSAATGVGNDRFTANWSAVSGAASYRLDVATDSSFSAGGSGAVEVLATNINTGLTTGWEYVNGATTASTYHKLVATGDPGVVSPAFSTVGYTNALAGFDVATYGGADANTLTLSYSLNGGSSWTAFGTNTSASSSTYVSGQTAELPEAALGQASVRVKWHCAAATATVGLRLKNLVVSGAQPAGASTLVLSGQGVTGTTYTVTGLAMGSTYYYRARSVGTLNGPYSATGTVTTAASDTAPSFSSMGGQSATVGLLFTLPVSSYASGYPVPTLSMVSSTANGADYTFAGGTLSFTPSATGTFAFVFCASNTLGVAGATATVAVAAAPVTIPTVSIANLSSNGFTANWTAVTGGTTYQVQVATDTNFTPGGVSGSNQMVNAGFETGDTTGWGTVESPYAVSSENPHSGSYCISCVGATSTRDLDQQVAIPAADGTMAYVISYWYRVTAGDGSDVRTWAQWNNGAGSGDILQSTNYNASSTEWTQIVLTNVPASGATNLDFEVRTYNGATAYFDDFSVTPVPYGRKAGSLHLDATVPALTYDVEGLTPSTPYYVRARSTGGTWSDVVTATTTSGDVPAPQPIEVTQMPTNGAPMGMQIATTVGVTYDLEYTTNLLAVPPVWVQVDSEAGTGGPVTLQDSDSLGIQRFYRVVKP